MTTIVTKNGSGAPLASDLVQGELAVDLTNKRLYTENSGGTVIEVGSNPTSLTTGTFTSTGIDDNATSTAITIDSSQNVGIGTTNPSELLHVSGSGGVYGRITETNTSGTVKAGLILERSAGNTDFLIENSGNLTFSTATDASTWTERMRIDASGNVGIGSGSTALSSNLEIHDNTTGDNAYLNIYNTGGGAVNDETSIQFQHGVARRTSKVSSTLLSSFQTALTFSTENSGTVAERMRIDSSGNLLVGTTTGEGTHKLVVNGFGSTQDGIYINGYSNQSMLCLDSQFDQTSTNGVIFRRNGNFIGNITWTSSQVSYNTSSDVRLKENIVDAPSASSDIDAIQIRSYDWKADGSHQKYGVVAQELVNVAPEAVSQGETEDDTWGVDYSKLVPMLVKEIQDLRARVAQLEEA